MLMSRLKQLHAICANPLVVRDLAGALGRGAFGVARRMAYTAVRSPDLTAEKVVSRKYRCLWLCNPKVASRSIIAVLRDADPDAEIIEGASVAQVYAMYPAVKDYFSFAFIRHPFDRALSLYAEMRFFRTRFDGANRCRKEERQRFLANAFFGLAEVKSFDDYCRWLNTPYGSDAFANCHFLSQHRQICLLDDRRPDFIGRLENIARDLERVAEHLGMPLPTLPMLNTMAGWQPRSPQALQAARAEMSALLTEQNRALLSKRYAGDLELGGYSP